MPIKGRENQDPSLNPRSPDRDIANSLIGKWSFHRTFNDGREIELNTIYHAYGKFDQWMKTSHGMDSKEVVLEGNWSVVRRKLVAKVTSSTDHSWVPVGMQASSPIIEISRNKHVILNELLGTKDTFFREE